MVGRRHQARPDAPDRRRFPRPPLWLNLLLLLIAVGGVLYARYHREQVSTRFQHVIQQEQRTPGELRKMKEELAEMDLNAAELQRELQARLKHQESLKSEDFYLSIDTKERKLRFYYGDKVLRESPIQIGEARTISGGGKGWTFVPLRGAFAVQAKVVGHAWQVPEWIYAMNNQPAPAQRPVIPNGLGQYVIFLPDGYAIHSQPSEESPLEGPKPGSFLVDADVLRAIWPRIHRDKTQVYIY